ncbi:hypothetical protein [Rossellomorea marisflavi]|uniref:hypothetical protein n=1 Tax=Rossellomorea marisflavi TaxID=189381 RepID=UPI00345C62D6
MSNSYYNSSEVAIVSAMFNLIENHGFTPDEVLEFIDKIKENTFEELIEVYNNI